MDSIVTTPVISVIMPVYNGGAFIKEAIDSILAQTFTDFEFFIIDDASTDESVAIIKFYSDHRIQFIQKPTNTGYTDSLNMALALAKGKYIVRMDADDISTVDRFKKQLEYIETKKDLLVLGTAYKIIGTETLITLPATYEEAKVISIMNVPVAHPTVMMRNEVFKNLGMRYEKKYEPAEDYDLWTRVLEKGMIESLPEPLLYYRQHPAQQSITRHGRLLEAAIDIRLRQLNKLISFNDKQYDVLFAIDVLTMQPLLVTGAILKKMALLIADIESSNKRNKIYNEKLLAGWLRERWLFYIFKLNCPSIKDFSLLQTLRQTATTQMGWLFELGFLKRMFFRNFLKTN